MENITRILNTYASSASKIRLAMFALPALSACFKLKACSPCSVAVAAIRPLVWPCSFQAYRNDTHDCSQASQSLSLNSRKILQNSIGV